MRKVLTSSVTIFALSAICLLILLTACVAKPTPPVATIVKKLDYSPAAASMESKRGQQLYSELTCANCHSIGGQGGSLGPPLDAVGAVRDQKFLLMRLSDSNERPAEFDRIHGIDQLMAHPRLPEAKAKSIVSYLLTLPAPVEGFEIVPHRLSSHAAAKVVPGFKPAAPSEKSRQGLQLFADNGCFSCHSVRGAGGWFGPALDGIGARRTPQFIAEQVRNPELNVSQTRKDHLERPSMMPKINLPEDDVEKIVAFLLTLPQLKGDARPSH